MDGWQVKVQSPQQLGEEWLRVITEKDPERLGEICHPDVRSRVMTPKRFDALENVPDLTQKMVNWYGDCSSIEKEQARIEMVGDKLAIFYRLRVEKNGAPCTIEQQLYCSLRDGRIDQLNLLCSGFQPLQISVEAPAALTVNRPATSNQAIAQPPLQAHALLEVGVDASQGSTCAILTPAIKRKLSELNSGQVLEVRVGDPDAKEDIQAWCRLSGNTLLQMERGSGEELHFYLMKK